MIKEYYTEPLWCISAWYLRLDELILQLGSINENKNFAHLFVFYLIFLLNEVLQERIRGLKLHKQSRMFQRFVPVPREALVPYLLIEGNLCLQCFLQYRACILLHQRHWSVFRTRLFQIGRPRYWRRRGRWCLWLWVLPGHPLRSRSNWADTHQLVLPGTCAAASPFP